MTEHSFKDAYRKKLKKIDPSVYWWKINDSFQPGVPDAFVELEDIEYWVEFKYIKKLPVRSNTLIDLMNHSKYLSLKQSNWLKRRYERKKDAIVVVGCPKGMVLFTHREWEKPITSAEFKEKIVPIGEGINQIHALMRSL